MAKYAEPSTPMIMKNDDCSERLNFGGAVRFLIVLRFLGVRLRVISSRVRNPRRMVIVFLVADFFLELESGSLVICRFIEPFLGVLFFTCLSKS